MIFLQPKKAKNADFQSLPLYRETYEIKSIVNKVTMIHHT